MDPQIRVGDTVVLRLPDYFGVEGVVWEVNDQHIAVIPTRDPSPEVTPVYVERERVAEDLRKLPADVTDYARMRRGPPGTTFALEALGPCRARYDFEVVHIWHTGDTGDRTTLELEQTCMTGVLGLSDGTFFSHRRLTASEWQEIDEAFRRLDFWDLAPHDRRALPLAFWQLSAFEPGRKHAAKRHTVPNDIQPLCELCFDLAARADLMRGSVRAAESED